MLNRSDIVIRCRNTITRVKIKRQNVYYAVHQNMDTCIQKVLYNRLKGLGLTNSALSGIAIARVCYRYLLIRLSRFFLFSLWCYCYVCGDGDHRCSFSRLGSCRKRLTLITSCYGTSQFFHRDYQTSRLSEKHSCFKPKSFLDRFPAQSPGIMFVVAFRVTYLHAVMK